MLNYRKIRTDILDYVVDNTPLKQGLYTPGMHIPVVPPDRILRDVPDYALLLAWNYLDEILKRNRGIENWVESLLYQSLSLQLYSFKSQACIKRI